MAAKKETKKELSIHDFLNKLEIRLKDFLTKQHYNICFFMKDDLISRDKAIQANNKIEESFKNLRRKYLQYLENRGNQPFEIITDEEFRAYNLALTEENESLQAINFLNLDVHNASFVKFRAGALKEIEENIELHSMFMALIRK